MIMKTNRAMHVEAVETIPVTCPKCGAALGTIDMQNLWKRACSERFSIPVWIAQPADHAGLIAEARLVRGECPVCAVRLATLRIRLGRDAGARGADQAPRIGLAMHGATGASWAMIEHHMKGFDIIEHVFGPIPDERVEEAFDPVLAFVSDLPRPEAA